MADIIDINEKSDALTARISSGTMIGKSSGSSESGTIADKRSVTMNEYDTQPHRDIYGKLWYQFVCDYQDGDVDFTFQIWARDIEDAERRMGLIKQNCKVVGQLISEVDA